MSKGIFLFFLLFSFFCFSQEDIKSDSLKTEKSKDSIKPHSIRTAIILSAALPGAGQIYNHIAMPKGQKKAFWKVPLIYAGLGASTYFLIKNQQTQKSLKDEYTLRLDGQIGNNEWSNYDDQGVLQLYEQRVKWRDLSVVAVAVVYLLQVTDAGVEAHFVNFDVSEDLTLSLDPVLMNYKTPGIGLTLRFK